MWLLRLHVMPKDICCTCPDISMLTLTWLIIYCYGLSAETSLSTSGHYVGYNSIFKGRKGQKKEEREKDREKDKLLNQLSGACMSQLQEILSLTCPAVEKECKTRLVIKVLSWGSSSNWMNSVALTYHHRWVRKYVLLSQQVWIVGLTAETK